MEPSTNPFPKIEESILSLWKEKRIAQQSLEAKRDTSFVFFEGPPTANAGPGFHHVIARVFKDIIPRYKFLKGFAVPRKAGWDTHGLPVELQIEKEIGTKTKSDIEAYGIAAFNRRCQESVWRFKQEWDRFTERIGFWLDLDHPFITYDLQYMESVWWLLKKIWQKGLLKQDYKVVPYCSRCGTPLSSHEVAQGYKDVKDTSVYLKFKSQHAKFENTYFLVWTTTPWTLPGNVALAVNPDLTYVYAKFSNGEIYIVAENRLNVFQESYEVLEKVLGKDLVSIRYEPLFPYLQNKNIPNIGNAFQVLPANFATDQEGTGIVHTAVMYGEDDFQLGKQFQLPEYHLVGTDGKFVSDVTEWQGMWVKDADPKIIEALKNLGMLYRTENITHTYPFCWRCKTPLLYYAHQSWFIMMSQLREQLLKNNELIHWEPGHLQQGRFGEWLREVKDWALSRDRYWGTPLPIWQCEADLKHQIAIGSIQELSKRAWQPNTYYLMRHGESTSNTEGYNAGWPEKEGVISELTEKGKQQVKDVIPMLKAKKIDCIIASDLTRIKQTAEILQKEFPGVEIRYDKRLREVDFGVLNHKPLSEFSGLFINALRAPVEQLFITKPEGGESPLEVQERVFALVREVEHEFHNKNILFISHGLPLWVLEGKLKNLSLQQTYELGQQKNAEVRVCPSLNLPYNEKQEVDLHRPYIDEIALMCPECGGKMMRVSQVIDCWFDSGAMPYAQRHFPFAFMKPGEDPDTIDYPKLLEKMLPFPADYISEAIDQTRGWFYTLHAIAAALDLGPAYKNVVCMGHVLDEKGEKMSKSKGNIINPWDMTERYGVDALRWYFYTVNSPGEYKKFAEKDLGQSVAELMVVLNMLNFFSMYAPERIKTAHMPEPKTVLDRWAIERVRTVAAEVGGLLDTYKIFEASRTLEVLFDDLSKWYVRRSRKQFQKPDSSAAFEYQTAFFGFLLLDLSRIMAPFTPFLAEHIWQEVKRRMPNAKLAESVHLDTWPEAPPSERASGLFHDMEVVRSIVAVGHTIRAQENISVQKPRQTLFMFIERWVDIAALEQEYCAIIKDEVNVKEVKVVDTMPESDTIKVLSQEGVVVGFDITETDELRLEGEERGYIRNYNALRKKNGFSPGDKAKICEPKTPELEKFYRDSGRLARIQGATNSTITLVDGIEAIAIEKINP
ncbi:MAG: Isoleucine-tRNA ligase [Parcubacteria group bacterium GW2011_GWB1_46_8]|nr:MAG: Isoleucine-tRNA ligase [Parcubacteria group bacterium GW2011_GWA1_45_7]KKU46111.1 MAG: Isoleucine-tRNA ligase [Parcubacteria group bacterium GW2011_GWB1_46_8]